MFFHSLLLFISILRLSAARSMNRTIDDEFGDIITGSLPQYYPSDRWSQGALCANCSAKLDSSRVAYHSWHDTTQDPRHTTHSVTVRFTGVAVYVYNALANDQPGVATLTNLTFTLDNIFAGSFTHTAIDDPDPAYDVLVYSNNNMENKAHTLTMAAAALVGSKSSLILFDYVVYTVIDNEQPPVPSSTSGVPVSQASSSRGFWRILTDFNW